MALITKPLKISEKDRSAWLARLKPGDKVTVCDGWTFTTRRQYKEDVVAEVCFLGSPKDNMGVRVRLESGLGFVDSSWIHPVG